MQPEQRFWGTNEQPTPANVPEPWIEAMSNKSESSQYKSNYESSQGSSEYHSGQELESESKQIILINRDEEFTFLNIRFPMPQTYPHPYIQLNELMSTVDLVLKSYDWITNIPGNPNCALGYIIHHFNIDRVSRSIQAFPPYNLDQVYYSTYVVPSRYPSFLNYYNHTLKQLQDALDKEWLELQKKYSRYLTTNDIPIVLLDCFLFL